MVVVVVVVGVFGVHWLSGKSASHDVYFKMFPHAHTQAPAPFLLGGREGERSSGLCFVLVSYAKNLFLLVSVASTTLVFQRVRCCENFNTGGGNTRTDGLIGTILGPQYREWRNGE